MIFCNSTFYFSVLVLNMKQKTFEMIICWNENKKQNSFVISYTNLCFRQLYDVTVVYLYHQIFFCFCYFFSFSLLAEYESCEELFIAFCGSDHKHFSGDFSRLLLVFSFTRIAEVFCSQVLWKMKIFHCLKIRVIGLEIFLLSLKKKIKCRYGWRSLLKIINHFLSQCVCTCFMS